MTVDLQLLQELHHDTQKCAKFIGLNYYTDESPGISRTKHGKGFTFVDQHNKTVTDKQIRNAINKLMIPPAWSQVWICPDPNGHIVATGIDEKGRKQYIYNEKWRAIRELINFYRLLTFGKHLPTTRKTIDEQLRRHTMDREQVLALVLWVLDHAYIRVGNESYFEQNESIGLTTMQKKHASVKGDTVTFEFRGKSGKDHNIQLKDARVARMVGELLKIPGARLFKVSSKEVIGASDLNEYLQTIAGTTNLSAKDFRTWGGTSAAFTHLKSSLDTELTADKVIIEAVDRAASVLGNTRAVAKAHYVHPHILDTFSNNDFGKYYRQIKVRERQYLDRTEAELLAYLEILFTKEFDLLSARMS
jgi:DNA topoisomerase-1